MNAFDTSLCEIMTLRTRRESDATPTDNDVNEDDDNDSYYIHNTKTKVHLKSNLNSDFRKFCPG